MKEKLGWQQEKRSHNDAERWVVEYSNREEMREEEKRNGEALEGNRLEEEKATFELATRCGFRVALAVADRPAESAR